MSNAPTTFDASPVAHRASQNALTDATQTREIAEIQAAMVVAKRFPRNPMAALERVKMACTRPSLAEGALYSYARGGSNITGPSIRLAEVLAQNWGNVQFGIRELEQSNGFSTVEAFAWDLETNTRQIKVFQVEHKRHTRKGAYTLDDPRDIYELTANQGARRLRACILGVIPGDVVEEAVAQCEATLSATADTSAEGLKRLLDAFKAFGVSQSQIEGKIQRRIDAIQPAQVVLLRNIYTSLKDGMSSPSDWFEDATPKQTSSVAQIINESLEAATSGRKSPVAAAPAPAEKAAPPKSQPADTMPPSAEIVDDSPLFDDEPRATAAQKKWLEPKAWLLSAASNREYHATPDPTLAQFERWKAEIAAKEAKNKKPSSEAQGDAFDL